jgi:myo-inositol-1(or 4)-monophosphatase
VIREEQALALLRWAESAALLAGYYLKNRRTQWQNIQQSSNHDIKIRADQRAEELIVEQLRACSPIPVLSEESGYINNKDGNWEEKRESDLQWVIDPLDGSLNYHQDIPFCCVSIALYKGKTPVLGAVYDFNRSDLFTALVGVGAWLNHDPITPSEVCEISDAVLGTGFPVNTDFSSQSLSRFIGQIQRFRKVRLLGSAALSLCYVACGRIDAYQEENIMFWDVAAGCALVRASGGQVQIENFRDPGAPLAVTATNGKLKMNLANSSPCR